MLRSGHPAISEITKYYFLHPSKQVWPVIALLQAQATNGLGGNWSQKLREAERQGAGGRAEELDTPLRHPDVLNDWNPSMPLRPKYLFASNGPSPTPQVPRVPRILLHSFNTASLMVKGARSALVLVDAGRARCGRKSQRLWAEFGYRVPGVIVSCFALKIQSINP